MSYKYPNIVLSISINLEAHNFFHKQMGRRKQKLCTPTTYWALQSCICQNLPSTVHDEIDALRNRNTARPDDKIPQDLWDELLEEFGYLEAGAEQPESAEEKLAKLICDCPKAWALLCNELEIRKNQDIPLTYTPGPFTLKGWTRHIPEAEKLIDEIKLKLGPPQAMWNTLVERYKAQTDPADFSTPSPTYNPSQDGQDGQHFVDLKTAEDYCVKHELYTNEKVLFDAITQPKEDKPMSVTVETKHLVNGQNVKDMSDNELLMCVQSLENELEDLDELKTQSKFIEKRKKELNEILKTVVKHLDARA